MNGTFVISAFPACGKTYSYKNYQSKFSILDSDSSQFSWIKDENGNNTDIRNPEFPSNYIQHIKDNIGKVDIIFVSSHEIVRKALVDNKIKVIMIYPDKNLKEEWIKRFKERGNTDAFIKFISNNWDKFIEDIEKEDYGFLKNKLCMENSYLDLSFLDNLVNSSENCTYDLFINS